VSHTFIKIKPPFAKKNGSYYPQVFALQIQTMLDKNKKETISGMLNTS
jgi:hypothetical protein